MSGLPSFGDFCSSGGLPIRLECRLDMTAFVILTPNGQVGTARTERKGISK